jgi:hypothetical protein
MLKTKSDMNLFNCTLRSLEPSLQQQSYCGVIQGRPAPAVAVLKYHGLNK